MHDFVDGDFFESLADYSFGDVYSENMVEPSRDLLAIIFQKYKKPVLFIETHRLIYLFKELENFPENICIIIAHNSDATYGIDLLHRIPSNVKRIWCQNYNYIETDVLRSLPIGLERVRWFPDQKKQEVLYHSLSEPIDKTGLVYMNFNPGTNPLRLEILSALQGNPHITKNIIGNGGDYTKYLRELKSHFFVISPPGVGIDCHRNFEAIYVGCIPIVLDSHFVRNVYKDLPVLIVDNYNLSLDYLINCYKDIIGKYRNSNLLTGSHWRNIILE